MREPDSDEKTEAKFIPVNFNQACAERVQRTPEEDLPFWQELRILSLFQPSSPVDWSNRTTEVRREINRRGKAERVTEARRMCLAE